MIRKPYLRFGSFSSRDNVTELARRAFYFLKKHDNPNNLTTVTPQQYRDYFKFTVVRNPWARAYSWYRNVTRGKLNRKRLGVDPEIGLNEFLRKFILRDALRSQISWIRDFDGTIPLDFIGRVENLEHDYATICTRLGIIDPKLQKARSANVGDYRENFDPDSARLIEEAYAEEIALFGYSFDSVVSD